MNKNQLKLMLVSYLRSFATAVLAGIVVVGGGRLPIDFTSSEWLAVANAVWIALLPVAQRWLSEGDTAFGRGSDS